MHLLSLKIIKLILKYKKAEMGETQNWSGDMQS